MCTLGMEIFEFLQACRLVSSHFIVCIHSNVPVSTVCMNSQSKLNTYLSQYSDDYALHDRRTWARCPLVAKQIPFVKYLVVPESSQLYI